MTTARRTQQDASTDWDIMAALPAELALCYIDYMHPAHQPDEGGNIAGTPTGAAALRKLYHQTGLGFMQCKRLLAAADGDFNKAMELRFALPAVVARRDYVCPQCGEALSKANQIECPKCLWLRFPSDRARWGKSGPCPKCSFSYRWDGERCSHCGLGTQ